MGKIQIEISEAEYCLLLNDAVIRDEFAELLESFVSDGEFCHVAATRDEVDELIRNIDEIIDEVQDRQLKKEFKKLCEYLRTV